MSFSKLKLNKNHLVFIFNLLPNLLLKNKLKSSRFSKHQAAMHNKVEIAPTAR